MTVLPDGDASPSAPHALRSRGGIGPLLPARLRPAGPPATVVELIFTALGYWAYTITRNAMPGNRAEALHRARAIEHTERLLHVDIELTVNHAADRGG